MVEQRHRLVHALWHLVEEKDKGASITAELYRHAVENAVEEILKTPPAEAEPSQHEPKEKE